MACTETRKSRESEEIAHTLHKKLAQTKGNANLITANDAARLQEQHGGVCGTRQQKNGGDDGWTRLKTGTDNEAAGNEDLEDRAKNLAKERPRNLSGQEPPNNPLHDSLKVVRLGIQAELGIKMSTLKLEEKSHGKQVKDKTNNKSSQETFRLKADNPEDDEEMPKETPTVLKSQMKLSTKFQEGWCNRTDARTKANNKCPCLAISLQDSHGARSCRSIEDNTRVLQSPAESSRQDNKCPCLVISLQDSRGVHSCRSIEDNTRVLQSPAESSR